MPNPETDAQPRDELHIAAGSITVLRMLDIAYAIDLAKVESLWTAHTSASTSRARLNATPAKAMAFGDPPVALHLAPMQLDFGQGLLECSVTASFYAFGAVALAIGVPLRDMPWPQLLRLNHEIDRRIGPAGEATLWLSLLQGVVAIVGPALEKPSPTQLQEDYVIVLLSDLSEHLSAEALMARVDLAPLLSGEERELSESARQDLLRQKFSYYADDLVVLTWDRAFVYEPRGDSDVLDVLEVANAQLLELRYYDELLDAELPRMYDQVEGARHAIALLAARQFANLARRLYTLVAEVTELTEKIDNTLQVTEDVYLARVYGAALTLFRVPSVAAAVDRKLSIIRDTYTALYEEASSRRAELLEIAIVVLIVVEIVLALKQWH